MEMPIMSRKNVLLGTLTFMFLSILFPPWGMSGNRFNDVRYGFLFTGPFDAKYGDVFTYSINWEILGAQLMALAVLGAIARVALKK